MITVMGQLMDQLREMRDRMSSLLSKVRNLPDSIGLYIDLSINPEQLGVPSQNALCPYSLRIL
jgi:hypothetical protein